MSYVVPMMVFAVVAYGLVKKVDVYAAFVKGAKAGLQTAVLILPGMGAMLIAIALMRQSGLLDGLTRALAPAFQLIGIHRDAVPLMLMRPLSGSGSLAMLGSIFNTHGADSQVGLLASTLMGSSETIFYTIGIYLAAANVKKSGYAIPAAMAAWLVGGVVAGLFYG